MKTTLLILSILLFFSCSTTENLFKCNNNDRFITGYSKNGKKYTVETGCGKWAEPVKICDSIIKDPGERLIALDIYR